MPKVAAPHPTTQAPQLQQRDVLFSFAVISDTHDHRRCRLGQGHWLAAALRIINRRRPAFVLGLGDLVAGGGDCLRYEGRGRAGLKAQLDELDEALLSKLRVGFVPVSGNHDLAVDESRNRGLARTLWRHFWQARAEAVFPAAREVARHTSLRFEHRGVGIVLLGYYGTEGLHRDELAWARRHVQPGDLIFRHINPYGISCINAAHCGYAMHNQGHLRPERLVQLLRARGVAALFAGHTHAFYDGDCDGLRFVNTGSLGARSMEYVQGWGRSPFRKRQAFVWVDVLRRGVLRVTFQVWDPRHRRFAPFDKARFPARIRVRRTGHRGGFRYGVDATCLARRAPQTRPAFADSPLVARHPHSALGALRHFVPAAQRR